MARCNCSGQTCSCVIEAGSNVEVTGSGSAQNPYVVSAAGGGEEASIPTGVMWMWGGSSGGVPVGWLLCDGSEVSQATYADLFAVLGSTYGTASAGNFRLPALQGKFPVGVDGSHPKTGAPAGDPRTGPTRTLVVDNMPQHRHTIAHNHEVTHNHGSRTTETDGSNGKHDHTVNPPSFTVSGGGHGHNASNTPGTGGSFDRGSGAGSDINAGPGTHSHTINSPAYDVNNQGQHAHTLDLPSITVTSDDPSTNNSGQAGAGTAFNIEPPFAGVYFIVKT